MPFFFAFPVCLVFVATGLVFLLTPRFRFLSAYFVLCSTTGFLLSFALSLLVFPLMDRIKVSHGTWFGWVVILTYLVAIGIGAIWGVVIGFIGARKINAHLRWQ
jgi:hypothetical protein